jgi:cell division protein FtsN
VQLAAYDTRAEADAAVARFTKRGIDTRVDGEAKPYRVRTGYYPTRDDATAALAKFKRAGQTGFLVEIAK